MRDFITSGKLPQPMAAAMEAAMTRVAEHLATFRDIPYDNRGKVERAQAENGDGFWSWNNGGFSITSTGHIAQAASVGSCPGAACWLVAQYEDGHLSGEPPMNSMGEALEGDYDDDEIDRDWLDGTYRYEVNLFVRAAETMNNDTGEDEIVFTVGVCPYEPGESGSWTYYLVEMAERLAGMKPERFNALADMAIRRLNEDRTTEGRVEFEKTNDARKAGKEAERAASTAYWSGQQGASA